MKQDVNTVFRQLTIRICSNPDLADALQECKQYLQSIMPVNIMHIGVIGPGHPGARIVAYVTDDGTVPIHDPWEIPLPVNSMEMVKNRPEGDICLLGNGSESPLYRMGAEIMGITKPFSVLNIKLHMGDDALGFVGLVAWGKDRYTDEDAGLLKPLSPVFAHGLSNTLRYGEALLLIDHAREDIRCLQKDLKKLTGDHVIGVNTGLKGVMNSIKKLVSNDCPVLLLGESGVGKGVIANAIHERSGRKNGPFISVHCGAVPGSLLFSELFGHDQGAFTGANQNKRGCFERANGGVLFLEEIGELPLEVQAEIVQVLAEKSFKRFGGSRTITTDVRLIASTHRNLGQAVQDGVFLEALWQKINGAPIVVPPLCLRKLDIPLLASHFVHRKAIEMNLSVIPSIADGEMEKLLRYDWPGNVRELENIIERALIFGQGKLLRFPDLAGVQPLPASNREPKKSGKMPTLDEVMIQHIRNTLEKTGGRIEGKGGAADLLGIHYNTLRARMKKLGISFGRSV